MTPEAATPATPKTADVLLSVIVLTRNEAANLEDAATSLLTQDAAVEILIVDGASSDGTVDIAKRLEAAHPGRVRLVASRELPIGPARNLGLEAARADSVAFVSADATVAPGWARAMLHALEDAHIVYGRQEHAPPRLNTAAIVRGLRYHHFRDDEKARPETYASNVNAAIRRDVFQHLRYVDEGPASALDDILFTREAQDAGLRIAYAAGAVVHHKDAATLRAELAKNRREGYGWGILSPQLGLNAPVIAWGGMIAVSVLLLALWPAWWTLLIFALVLWAPTLRRAARAGSSYLARRPHALLAALLVSPFFDLMFLLHYSRGLISRRGDLTGRLEPHGTRSP